jgi:hypothetical protein
MRLSIMRLLSLALYTSADLLLRGKIYVFLLLGKAVRGLNFSFSIGLQPLTQLRQLKRLAQIGKGCDERDGWLKVGFELFNNWLEGPRSDNSTCPFNCSQPRFAP